MTPDDLKSFREFWPYYLAEHRLPICRAWHYFGTSMATSLFAWLLWQGHYASLWWVLIAGYAPAWIGHFVFEKNRPATFTYPRWSLIADYKMFWYWLSGQLDEEMQRHGHIIFDAPPAEKK